jgi:hypothetical protein
MGVIMINYYKAFLMKAFFCYAFILLVFVPIAYSEDFTFNVPVDIKNLHPDLKKGAINCTIHNKSKQWIGQSEKYFDIINGSYSGTVVVKFNTTPPSNNVNAYYWACALYLPPGIVPNLGNYFACDVTKPDGPYSRDTSKPCKDSTGWLLFEASLLKQIQPRLYVP